MLRLIVAIVLTVIAVAFTLSNTHHVQLSFVFGQAVHIRMIFLLFSTFIAGSVTTIIIQQFTAMKEKQLQKRRVASGGNVDERDIDD